MIFEFDPKKYRFAVEIGIPGKLERLDKIPRPRPNETVACAININVFDWVKNFDGYGEIEQDGRQLKPESKGFPSISFKDGKLTLGDLPGAQVGVGIPITLVIYGKKDIRNPSKLTTGKDQRTAVGQKSNGNILFVTVEDMTTEELANYMLKQGCINAFQGDSGGSTGYFDSTGLHDQVRAIAGALVAYKPIEVEKVNIVIAYSQQRNNKCKMGDTEQDHMRTIANVLYDILSKDKKLNAYLIPLQNTGADSGNLKASINLSNNFVKANGGKGIHIELHSDAGGYAKGCSALYKSEAGKKLATALYNELADLTPTTDAGIRKRDDLGALNQTIAVATILEVSFHDNALEAEWLHEESIPIAVRLANGIYKFLKGESL